MQNLKFSKKGKILLIVLCTTISTVCARHNGSFDPVLEEMRLELADVKHELHSARVEMHLLEEKLVKQERAIAALREPEAQKKTHASQDSLEKKVAHLEKLLEKITVDVRTLSNHTQLALNKSQDVEAALHLQDKKWEEIGKLKGTLSHISKAMSANTSAALKTYLVKAGDSLEKVARAQHTTVEAIKQMNQLTSDKIVVGQELKLPNE